MKEMVEKDPIVKKYLNDKDINSAFDVTYYLRNIGDIYKRIGIN
jgi:adenylosuccinate lyase